MTATNVTARGRGSRIAARAAPSASASRDVEGGGGGGGARAAENAAAGGVRYGRSDIIPRPQPSILPPRYFPRTSRAAVLRDAGSRAVLGAADDAAEATADRIVAVDDG